MWSEDYLGAFWIAKDAQFLHVDSEDHGRTTQVHLGRRTFSQVEL